ncbi:MAG: DUF2993 domain-containing protein [Cyanobacteriota bacterium]|nr:DUF2993 domain-containing protein [Cyanobacteriota bacterium]
MKPENPGMAQQAVNKAAELIFSTQIEGANNLEVEVNAHPDRITSGAVDSIWLSAEEVALSPNLQVEKLDIQMVKIAIDPLRAVFGNVQLTQPSEGKTRIVLNQENLAYALNSQKVRDRLQAQDFVLSDRTETIELIRVECQIKSISTIKVNTEVLLQSTGEKQFLSFEYTFSFDRELSEITIVALEDGEASDLGFFRQVQGFISTQIYELLNLRHFELEGVSVCVCRLDVRDGALELQAQIDIQKIPSKS